MGAWMFDARVNSKKCGVCAKKIVHLTKHSALLPVEIVATLSAALAVTFLDFEVPTALVEEYVYYFLKNYDKILVEGHGEK